MRELIKVLNGQSIIKIDSDGYSECLIIHDTLISIIWSTHYQYYAVTKYDIDLLRFNFLNLDLVESDFTDKMEGTLSKLKDFMNLFQPGEYIIELKSHDIHSFEIAKDSATFQRSPDDVEGDFTWCTWTESSLIALSKSTSLMDSDAIDHYKYQILDKKERPIVLVYQVPHFSDDSFVLDGNHKLLAYKDLLVNPYILTITRVAPQDTVKDDLQNEYEVVLNEAELNHYKWMKII